MKVYICLIFLFCQCCFLEGQQNLFTVFGEAGTLFEEEKYEAFLPKVEQLLAITRHPVALYWTAKANAHLGNDKMAFQFLEELAKKGWAEPVDTVSLFTKYRKNKRFRKLTKRFKKNQQTIHSATKVMQFQEDTLIPEGIASHSTTQKIYLSSLAQHKIVVQTIGQPNSEKDLISSGQDSIWMVLGMKVLASRNEIWVASTSEKDSTNGYAGLFGFDLISGKLINKVILDNTQEAHLFNDLVFADENTLYLTDSKAGKVFKSIRPFTTLEEVKFKGTLYYPNGIAIDDKAENLFIADATGLYLYHIQSKILAKINEKKKTYLHQIDGLYFYKNSLIAVQGAGLNNSRITRFWLKKNKPSIKKTKILQSHHPDFVLPTTGTILNDDFYFIVNSYLRALQPDGKITNPEKLEGTFINKIPLY